MPYASGTWPAIQTAWLKYGIEKNNTIPEGCLLQFRESSDSHCSIDDAAYLASAHPQIDFGHERVSNPEMSHFVTAQ